RLLIDPQGRLPLPLARRALLFVGGPIDFVEQSHQTLLVDPQGEPTFVHIAQFTNPRLSVAGLISQPLHHESQPREPSSMLRRGQFGELVVELERLSGFVVLAAWLGHDQSPFSTPKPRIGLYRLLGATDR